MLFFHVKVYSLVIAESKLKLSFKGFKNLKRAGGKAQQSKPLAAQARPSQSLELLGESGLPIILALGTAG